MKNGANKLKKEQDAVSAQIDDINSKLKREINNQNNMKRGIKDKTGRDY